MIKKIYLINSKSNCRPLAPYLSALNCSEAEFSIYSSDKELINICHNKKIKAKKIYYLSLWHKKKLLFLLFLITLPFHFLVAFLWLIKQKFWSKLNTLICVDKTEKILFTPIAKILKIEIFWLELLPIKKSSIIKPSFFKKLFYNKQKIICFTNFAKTELSKYGFNAQNILKINPGINLDKLLHQDTIFNKFAQSHTQEKNHKFFTIGTSLDLNKEQYLETLFQAVKKSLTVIPNIQLIIVGNGPERKKLTWVAKKLDIGNLVWFVGHQIYLRKWLENFDIYVVSQKNIDLKNLRATFEAMAAKLPIIAPEKIGYRDIISDPYKNNIISMSSSDDMAKAIISLQQDKRKRLNIGNQNNEKVLKNYNLKNSFEQLKQILEIDSK